MTEIIHSVNNTFIEISSNGGRIGRIAWSNHPIFSDTFGRVYWFHWPFSFEIERTVVEAKLRKLRAKYTLNVAEDCTSIVEND